jgi:thymidine kinase
VVEKKVEKMAATLEVVTGPMYAGKSAHLVSTYDKLLRKKVHVRVFKHEYDTRPFFSRRSGGEAIPFTPAKDAHGIAGACLTTHDDGSRGRILDHVLVDEIHFFPADTLPDALKTILRLGTSVTVYGLDLDSRGASWAATERLMPFADKVTKLAAVCPYCGQDATMTQRLVGDGNEDRIRVGSDDYEPRCRQCWEPR